MNLSTVVTTYVNTASRHIRNKCKDLENSWNFGELRGGTPALYFKGQYLLFFHSKIMFRSCHSKLYVVGALMFNASSADTHLNDNSELFTVTKISKYPIINDKLIFPMSVSNQGRMSVVFPMTFLYYDKSGKPTDDAEFAVTIALTCGVKDSSAVTIHLNIDEFMKTLVDLNC